MCSGNPVLRLTNPFGADLAATGSLITGDDQEKLEDQVDPVQAYARTGDEKKLLGVFAPKQMPKPPPPPPRPQAARAPDTTPLRRRNANSLPSYGSTMLTGTTGVSSGSLNLGSSTLLGN